MTGAGEKTTTEDGQGCVIEHSAENKSNWVQRGAATRLVITCEGEASGMLRDLAEVSPTAGFAPVNAEVGTPAAGIPRPAPPRITAG